METIKLCVTADSRVIRSRHCHGTRINSNAAVAFIAYLFESNVLFGGSKNELFQVISSPSFHYSLDEVNLRIIVEIM